MRRLLIPLLAALLLVPAAPSQAQSRVNVRVGIGEQSAGMFAQDAYQALRIRRVRYFIRWNAASDPAQMQAAREYVLAARRNRASVLMHISTDDFTPRAARLPTVRQYRSSVGRIVRTFRRLGVREWGVWNEANHVTQPTWRSPRRAGQFFVEMRRLCRGCTIVALDVLDQRGSASYIRRWFQALSPANRRRATIVGIHNYGDVNRRRVTGTRTIERAVRRYNRRANFWWTETGGLAEFGRSFPCSERRQASRTRTLFSLARRYRRSVDRIYIYNWTGTDCSTRFDAGLVDAAGNPRPAYDVVLREIRRFRR
jgi:hypothetical protein